ncbi:MAG: thioredoxin family protein [Candidatus Omnitrophota bacterium]
MKIKVFGKKDCAKCETTKNKLNHFIKKNNYEDKIILEFQDMDTVDGMAEGAYYDVLKIPTSIVEKDDEVMARWDGEVPKTEDFSKAIE